MTRRRSPDRSRSCLPPGVRCVGWAVLAACAFALLPPAARAAGAADAFVSDNPVDALRAEAMRLEQGADGTRDPARAALLYCAAARRGDVAAQVDLGLMYAEGRGIERNEVWAAYFFKAAAHQGSELAARHLIALGGAWPDVPECMRETDAAPVTAAASKAAPAAAAAVPPPPPPPPARAMPPQAIARLVQTLAPKYGVEPQLALAIMQVESNFDRLALSAKNAQGLMQLVPETAERFGVADPFDPKQNLRGGLAYLRWLLAYFEGDLALVAAAYNAGEGAVERHRGVPPYPETRRYVGRVLAAVGALVHPFDAKAARPSAQLRLIQRAPPAPTTALAATEAATRAAAGATAVRRLR